MTDTFERLTLALAGRYTIERELGHGGMATVYLARDERHHRPVALKVMLREVMGAVGVERFRREIQIAARLTHPHIVAVFDSGEADELFFYVMPFVEGESLAAAIAQSRQLAIEEAISITRQVADALDYAHSEGVVHRDIKPENILLVRSRQRTGGSGGNGRTALVMDFGIARAMSGDGGARLTSTGLMVGTPTYMSPEQWGSDTVDGRSDQYSLACVLYEMLIGEPPFTGSNPMVVLARHTMELVPSLRIARPSIPDALEQVVFRAMSKVPADRYATMADFADAITAATDARIVARTADGAAASAAPSPTAPSPRALTMPGKAGPLVRTGQPRSMLLGAVTVLLLAVSVAGWVILRSRTPSRTNLMVLPFGNSGAVADSSFADGLTEEIISRLSGIRRLGVVARASSMSYRGTRKRAREIGRELGVSKLVQGTVRWNTGATDARRAIVRVSIVNVADETETPVNDFDAANLDDLYGIASAVAAKLDVTTGMEDEDRIRLLERPTRNRDAYHAYQQGNHFFNHSWDSSDVKAAIANYDSATHLDPKFALALAALGRAHGWMYQLGIDESDTRLRLAKQAIDSALHLAPDLPEAHLALGTYFYWGNRDYERALREFNFVRSALPSNAEAFNFIGNVSRRKGAWKEAADSYRMAAELDPRSHQTLFNHAETLLYLRNFDESQRLVDRVIELAPEFLDGYLLKAALQIHRHGQAAMARKVLAELTAKIPPNRWRQIGHQWRAGLFRIVDDSLGDAERRIVPNMFGLNIAQYLLSRAEMYRRFGQPLRAHVYYDSAATYMEATVKRHPEWPAALGLLGIALAGLERKEEAVRAAEQAARVLNETTDALDGPEWVANVALVYVMLGNSAKALDWLERAMTTPSRLSPVWIDLDPAWIPLRGEPRFRKLVRQPPPLRIVTTPAR